MQEEKLYTVKEIAFKYKVHKRTVLRWIHTGKLKGISIAGNIRIPETELNKIIIER